ncbi:MAG TPA: nucleotide exchange factor GrpE [Burkholderiaceae bacterium]|nr:nucleotide exchange factor GrpE [Burkholderiaceae bacterium]
MAAGESEVASGEALPRERAPDTGQAQAQTPVDALAQAQLELQRAQATALENHDLYLRARAEAENVRRRSQDDVSKAHKYAIESFAEALVPVFDSLEKALQDEGSNPEALREGVKITLRQLRAAFERGRLTEINPVGEKFDPHRHQAIATVPGDGTVAANHVVTVLQKGWMIADRVLRPALVTVAQSS